ncbi:MAG: HEAT repeat domain-containing protein [Planctomycetes bacterium]|nr:HEAT repeat domain-containing protein [Planctomycetota bacterium]
MALAARDPVQALDAARPQHWRALAPVAQQHGLPRHVPQLLRAWRAEPRVNTAVSAVQANPVAEALLQALERCGRGSIELIELGTTGSAEHGIALVAAKGARIADLERLLKVLPGLDWGIIETANAALAGQLGPDHAPQLLAALDAILPAVAAAPQGVPRGHGAPGAIVQADCLLQHLDRLAVAAVGPRAARIVREAIGDPPLRERAGRVAFAHAGAQRGELLRACLADERASVVGIALQQLGGAEWATFADVATVAILRTGPLCSDLGKLFDGLDRDARTALALAVLGAPARRTFAPELLRLALGALTAGKDARHLAQIQALVDDPRPDVRRHVAAALGLTFDRAAAPLLLELLKDEDDGVVEVASAGLKRLADYLQTRSEWESKLK